jgi:hypothetical protein
MNAEFPGNSKIPRPQNPAKEPQEKIVEPVVANAEKRKKSLLKRFTDVFIGGDSKSVIHYVVMDVLVPQAKDMMAEAASQGFERLIYGESRPNRRGTTGVRPAGPTNYTRYAVRGNNPLGRAGAPDASPVPRARTHHFDDILLATRVEAETVIERLYDLLNEYESVSVADLHSLVGWTANYTDQKWGWTSLQGAGCRRSRDGYVLELPRPIPLD